MEIKPAKINSGYNKSEGEKYLLFPPKHLDSTAGY